MGRASLAERPRTLHRSTSTQPDWRYILQTALGKAWVSCAIITVLSMVAYAGTWDSYFICDDFPLIGYIHNAMSTSPLALLREFGSSTVSQYQIYASMYRPLFLINLLASYLLFGINPAGYHLINFLAHLGCTLAFYATVRTVLGNRVEEQQKRLVALAAACLFGTSPLHLEVICFNSSSSDSTALMLSLLSFCTFVLWSNNKRILNLIVSLSSFVAAILIKEPAAGVPFMSLAWLLLLGPAESISRKLLKVIALFSLLLMYLGARYNALGTFIGGYTGAPGEYLGRSWIERLNLESASKVLIPLNESLPAAPVGVTILLIAALCTVVAIGALRFYKRSAAFEGEWRLDAFALCWLLIAIAPVLPVWQASSSLTGLRYFLFASGAFYFLLVWQLRSAKSVFSKTLAALAFGYLLASNIVLSQFNSTAWTEASLQGQRVQQEVMLLTQKHPDQKLVLVNLPEETHGACMFVHDRMVAATVEPPFVPKSVSESLMGIEFNRLSPQLVNVARARQLAADRQTNFFAWNRNTTAARKLDLEPVADEVVIDAVAMVPCHIPNDDGHWFELIFDRNIPNLGADFFEVHFNNRDETKPIPAGDIVMVGWRNESEPSGYSSVSSHPAHWNNEKYVFPLSEQTNWFASPSTNTLLLRLPDGQVPTSATITGGSSFIGKLQPSAPTGIPWIECSPRVSLNFDASAIAGAQHCFLEFSKTNCQFQIFDRTYRSNCRSELTAGKIALTGLKGQVLLSPEQFPTSGFHQVRLVATDNLGDRIGFVSDPVTVKVPDRAK